MGIQMRFMRESWSEIGSRAGSARLLHRLVRDNLRRLDEAIEHGFAAPLPAVVRDELEAFVRCGVLAHGRALIRCPDCGGSPLEFLARAAASARAVRAGEWQKRRQTWSVAKTEAAAHRLMVQRGYAPSSYRSTFPPITRAGSKYRPPDVLFA